MGWKGKQQIERRDFVKKCIYTIKKLENLGGFKFEVYDICDGLLFDLLINFAFFACSLHTRQKWVLFRPLTSFIHCLPLAGCETRERPKPFDCQWLFH